jgi:hypothetical protein
VCCLNAGVGIKRLVVGDFGEVVAEVDGVFAGHRKTIIDEPILQIPSSLSLPCIQNKSQAQTAFFNQKNK